MVCCKVLSSRDKLCVASCVMDERGRQSFFNINVVIVAYTFISCIFT